MGKYALIALMDLQTYGKLGTVSAKSIADRHLLDESMLKLALSKVAAKKIISAVRGPGGGFALGTRDLSELTVYEVLDIIEELPSYKPIAEKTGPTQATNQLFEGLHNDIIGHFKTLKLADLME